jgi:hypothetical protein
MPAKRKIHPSANIRNRKTVSKASPKRIRRRDPGRGRRSPDWPDRTV